jgi:hypothetical protein
VLSNRRADIEHARSAPPSVIHTIEHPYHRNMCATRATLQCCDEHIESRIAAASIHVNAAVTTIAHHADNALCHRLTLDKHTESNALHTPFDAYVKAS